MTNNQPSPQQLAIIKRPHNGNHMLVCAAPGSGKTRVITERVAYLLEQQLVAPEQIVVMTFTEKAAAHLIAQLEDRLAGAVQGMWAGTIHTICNRLLERHGDTIGLKSPFKIYDAQRQAEALRSTADTIGLDLSNRTTFYTMRDAISRRKRLGLAVGEQRQFKPYDSVQVLAYDTAYRALLKAHNALDFDDLIMFGNTLLSSDPETINAVHDLVRYVFIDEFHDLSPDQFTFLTLLVPPHAPEHQVMVVADPNQAIYGWRDADAAHLLDQYQRLYRCELHQLVQNYRSPGNIVRAAQHLIAGNGVGTHAVAIHADSFPIHLKTCTNMEAEAYWIAQQIKRARTAGGYSYGDIALLYRDNWRANQLEVTLLRESIPLRREQDNRFFEDPDVQATLRYLSLLQALNDEHFESSLHWPRVLVDEITMAQLQRLGRDTGLSLSVLARQIDDYADDVSPLTRVLIKDFLDIFDVELADIADQPISAVVSRLLAVLKRRRNPISATVREDLKGVLETLNQPLEAMVDQLAQAIAEKQSVVIAHDGRVDSVAGAFILKHILAHYFQHPVVIQRTGKSIASGAFLILCGLSQTSSRRGFGLGVYESRRKTLTHSISTQAWRIGQRLLMRYEMQRQGRFVLFDLETTGTHTRTTEVLEMAAIEVNHGIQIERTYHRMVRPTGRISPEASRVHGITEDVVKGQPTIDAILPSYISFLGNATLVGHNVTGFDLPILKRIASEHALPLPSGPVIDTCTLARRLLPDYSHRLEALAHLFGYREAQTHRALDDVRLNGKIFSQLLNLLDRDREIDIAGEVLPLVALGIYASHLPMEDYNLWLAQAGARALAYGLGADLHTQMVTELDDVCEQEQYKHWLAELDYDDPDEDRRWSELTQQWQNALQLYHDTFDDQSLGGFLEYVRLACSLDDHAQDDDRVTLTTIHSAKGKEWPFVFVVGVEDGTIPSYRIQNADGIAEERRVLYVAMTRAQQRLCLSNVTRLGSYRKMQSRFLPSIPDSFIKKLSVEKP